MGVSIGIAKVISVLFIDHQQNGWDGGKSARKISSFPMMIYLLVANVSIIILNKLTIVQTAVQRWSVNRMDDLISRQAAIKAAKELVENYSLLEDAKSLAESYMKIILSAQPEIIRCKDCKHYNADFECLIEGYGIERDKDWFCADAERRTDD